MNKDTENSEIEIEQQEEKAEDETQLEAVVEPALTQEEESFKDKYLRTRADLENIQRRMRSERNQLRTNTIISFTKELLPFIDNLDRALDAAENSESELVKGLKMNVTLLEKILSDNNINRINNEGGFDANLHEAVTSIEDVDKPNNSIAAVLETGYILGDRVIRYSKVQVTTGGPEIEGQGE